MTRRLLAVPLVALALLALLLAIAAGWGAFEPPAPNPEIRPAPIGVPDWTVTRRYSVNRVLIVEGECPDRERALAIARSLVGPSTESYDEVLVYVRPPGAAWTRRVQWTKKDGYRVLDY